MDKLIDAAFGIHPQAMTLGARRLELIAGNMANADTPNFKARDIDFRTTLEDALSRDAASATTARRTRTGHQQPGATVPGNEPMFRVPLHPALDGNTVDTQLEQSAFAEASVRYQASVDFLDGRIQGLRKALRGE